MTSPQAEKRAGLGENKSASTVLIITQVYVPDPASVGQHIADVAREMALRGWRVVVYTSARGYDDPSVQYPGREWLDGVDVRRLPLSSFGKRSIPVRLLAQACFMVQAIALGLFARRLGLVLVSTSPPFAGIGGALINFIRQVPFLWWVMDLNPDQMVAAGKLRPTSVFVRVFDWMNRVTLRRAARVVALDSFMAERLNRKVDVSEKTDVMPPWPHTDPPAAETARDCRIADAGQEYRRQHGCDFIAAMPPNLYGPGDNFDVESGHVLPALIRRIHAAKVEGAKEVVIWGSGTPLREFMYVEDVADALVFLLRTYSGEAHVNVGGGEEISIRGLAERIAGIVGYRGGFRHDTRMPDGTPRKLLDGTRLAALGWAARTPLDEGIRRTYDWFQSAEAGVIRGA
jgi:hypothetical protein